MEGNNPTSKKYNIWAGFLQFFSCKGSRSNKRDSDGSLPKSLTDVVTFSRTSSDAPTGSEAPSTPGYESTEGFIEVSTIEKIEDANNAPKATKKSLTVITSGLTDSEAAWAPDHESTKKSIEVTTGGLIEHTCVTPEIHKLSSFLDMAVTLNLFFDDKNSFGGFCGEPFMRFQRGNNQTCWQCAACVWLSLLVRMRTKDTSDSFIVDIPQRVRRFVSSNPKNRDKKIENRVLNNAGDLALNFAHTFFKDGPAGTDCVETDTANDEINLQRTDLWMYAHSKVFQAGADLMKNYLEMQGPGLINNFTLAAPFKAAAEKKERGYGYWEFTRNSIDDGGKFVRLEADENQEKFKASLRNKAEQEINRARDEVERLRKYYQGNEAQIGGRRNGADRSSTTKDTRYKCEGKHSMVVLGGKIKEVWDDLQNKFVSKQCYLCLNSWHQMPLVLVSSEYLTACDASILFREKAVTKEQKLYFTENQNCLAVGMASPSATCDDPLVGLKNVFNDEYKAPEPSVAACPGSIEDEGDY